VPPAGQSIRDINRARAQRGVDVIPNATGGARTGTRTSRTSGPTSGLGPGSGLNSRQRQQNLPISTTRTSSFHERRAIGAGRRLADRSAVNSRSTSRNGNGNGNGGHNKGPSSPPFGAGSSRF